MSEDEQPKEEKFNFGLAKLLRINELFYMLSGHMVKGEYRLGFTILGNIRDEINFSFTDAEEKEIDTEEEAINKFIKEKPEFDKTFFQIVGGVNCKYIKHPDQMEEIRKLLRLFDRHLQKLMKSHGLLMPSKTQQSMF